METLFVRLPDLDELLAWVRGEGLGVPLSEEERARIREIERVRVEAQREVLAATAGLMDGPVVGSCDACGKPVRATWRFCTFCGAPTSASCPRCHAPRPRVEGAAFCPQCGGRL
jgi:hypothetical protein